MGSEKGVLSTPLPHLIQLLAVNELTDLAFHTLWNVNELASITIMIITDERLPQYRRTYLLRSLCKIILELEFIVYGKARIGSQIDTAYADILDDTGKMSDLF